MHELNWMAFAAIAITVTIAATANLACHHRRNCQNAVTDAIAIIIIVGAREDKPYHRRGWLDLPSDRGSQLVIIARSTTTEAQLACACGCQGTHPAVRRSRRVRFEVALPSHWRKQGQKPCKDRATSSA